MAGRSGERTLIAALYPMPDGSKVHAASFVFDDEVTPVALMRTHTSRDEVLWTTCSSCMGESGVIQFRDDATITIAQR